MRSLILMGMFAASLAQADWNDYEEVRELELDAGGVEMFRIDAGAGSLKVDGVRGSEIRVTATIGVNTRNEDKARKAIEERMTLTLERDGDTADLVSSFDNGMFGKNGWIALEIEMPKGMKLVVDDGSGSIVIRDTEADVVVDDGSGSLQVYNVGALEIDDGSGSIKVEGANGDVSIVDGSGSISVRGVDGSVTIDDGSGSISVADVERDLNVIEDGSGSVTVADVRGDVEIDD